MDRDEKWLPIPGYEGIYEVSDLGRVRSLDRINAKNAFQKGKPKKPTVGSHGYLLVYLYKFGKGTTRSVHSLVLETFKGPAPKGYQGCHWNGDRADARLENLRWATPSENEYDKQRHGTDHEVNKTHCPRGHPLKEPNLVPSKLRGGSRECLSCSRSRTSGSADLQKDSDERYALLLTGEHEWSRASEGTCRRGHLMEDWNVHVKPSGSRECASCRRAYWHGKTKKERFEKSWIFYNEKLEGRNEG